MNDVRFRDVVAFVWGYWRQVPGLLLGAMGCILAATACDVFLPLAAGALIDSLVEVTSETRRDQVRGAFAALAVLIALSVGYHLLREASYRFWIPLATVTMRRITCDAFHRVQRFTADWHANNFAGATVRKISRGMWAYDVYADTVYHGFLPAAVILLGVTASLFWHWPLMGAYVLAAVAVYVAVSVIMATLYIAPANVVMNEADSAMGAALADAVTCNPTVKSFGAEAREDKRFFAVADRWRARARHAWTREINGSAAQSVLTLLLMAGLLTLALWYWAEGLASPGEVTFVMTSYFVVNGYLREVGMHVRNLQQAVNEIEDLVRFRRQELEVPEARRGRHLRAAEGEIALRDVTFTYGNKQEPIYDDFSLEIAAGERVALVGPDPALFHRSLAENIAYGRPEASHEEIVAAARRAHAHDFISALPQGYDTLVGERGVKLSGGERQRVAIARAFLADAPVLVMDEATSSLDSMTEAQIQEAIEDLMEGRTTIVIAHRLSTVRAVDRILVFQDGAIVEQGSHAELLAREEGHFKRLHRLQLEGLAL